MFSINGCPVNYWFSVLLIIFLTPIPSRSESLFDRLIRQNGGQIPIPLTKLTDMITKRAEERIAADGTGTVVVEKVLVPEGRSVQRKSADSANPRVLYAIDTPEGKIFLGFAKNAKQIEIISWNQSEQRFDFQVVQNYTPGGKPNVHTPSGSCTSCHQNNGPIFPKSPWSEMENQTLIDEMRRDTGGNSYEGIDLPPVLATTPADSFDRMVRGANSDLQKGTMCQQVCGPERTAQYRQCRKNLLLLAVNDDQQRQEQVDFGILGEAEGPSARDKEIVKQAITELKTTLNSTWPSNNFAFINPELPDRNPVSERTNPPNAAQKKANDPLTKRNLVNGQSKQDFLNFVAQNQAGLLQCLGMDMRDKNALKNYRTENLRTALNNSTIDQVLDLRPANRDALTANLIRLLAPANQVATQITTYCSNFITRTPVVGGPKLELLDQTSQKLSNNVYEGKDLFIKYCSRCHTSDNNPLPFDDHQAMKNYGEGNPNDMIQTRLQRYFNPTGDGPAQMPPEGTTPMPSIEERRTMIRTLNRTPGK